MTKKNIRNHVVYSDSEMKLMQKYLKDISMMSNKGDYPKYEIGKLASMFNLGGETLENYLDRVG
jgi:hypothetical protein